LGALPTTLGICLYLGLLLVAPKSQRPARMMDAYHIPYHIPPSLLCAVRTTKISEEARELEERCRLMTVPELLFRKV